MMQATPSIRTSRSTTVSLVDETGKKASRNRGRRTEQEQLKNTWAAD